MSFLHRFRAVIFDFDGVIVDSETLQARAWSRLADDLGLGPMPVTVAQIAGKLDRHIAPVLFPSLDVPTCVARKQTIERDMEAAGGLAPISDTLAFARRISATHAIAICSSSRSSRIERILDLLDARPLFPLIVGQLAPEDCKPSPAPYLKALALLNLPASAACAIEDSPPGIASAKAAGIYAVQLLHPGLSPIAQSDRVVRSASELL